MRFFAILIAVSAVVALPIPQETEANPKETLLIHPRADYIPSEFSGSNIYFEQPLAALPPDTTRTSHDVDEDPAGTLFGYLQKAVDLTTEKFQQIPGVAPVGAGLHSAAQTIGDAVQENPEAAALGAGAAAMTTFFNPPPAPAKASVWP